MAAAHSSRMACPGAANNRLFTMGLLGRASSVSMANARCTLLLISSSRSCSRCSSPSSSPLLSKKEKVRSNTNFSPWRSRLSTMGVMSLVDLKPLSGGTSIRVAFCRAGMDSAAEAVAEKKPFQEVVDPATVLQAIQRLQEYWTSVGCAVMQSSDTEVGSGSINPTTFLRVLRPEPWNVAYVKASVRPHDSRYGENPNRVQKHSQFQVILKLDPGNSQDIYLGSLAALGIDIKAHDVRFVEDIWESPVLGAWGLGREVWMDGMEITQFTYFQQAGSIPLVPVSVEITYDLERILTSLQEDEGSEGRAGKVLSLQPHDLEAFYNEGISSEVTCRRTSEQADSVRGSTLLRSSVGREEEQAKVEELAKVVEIMRQSLVSVVEHLEALVRQKEITDGSSKIVHVREAMSDSAIASALTTVETIGSSLNGIPIECEHLKSSRSLMEIRKSVQQKEAKRSLNHNIGLRKQNFKLTEDTAAINGIRIEDEKFMGEALVEAKKAAMAGEVPVGAVIVQKGKIIARAYNRVESDGDPTAHAEMLCLRSAARQHGDWRLMDATVYVTLEPCPMCAGAILQSRVKRLVWGSRNTLLGADGSWVSLFPELVEEEMDSECQRSENGPGSGPSIHPFHTSLEVRRQVLADECSTVMRSFFKARRTLKIHFLKTKPWWVPLSAWVLFKRMVSWWCSLVEE